MNWSHFFLVMKYPIRYPLKGIISDGEPAIQEAREAVYPDVPWQLCVRHFEKELSHFLHYRFTQKRGYWREIDRFLKAVHRMLYARSFGEAKRYLSGYLYRPWLQASGAFRHNRQRQGEISKPCHPSLSSWNAPHYQYRRRVYQPP